MSEHRSRRLKIYGPMRSGTNYLAYLVEQNFAAFVRHNEGGWKHGPPAPVAGVSGYLLTIKHPIAWIDSMLRYPLVTWPSVSWLAREWNRHADRLLGFSFRGDAKLVRYDRLLRDRRGVLEDLGKQLSLPRTTDELVDTDRAMRRGGDHMTGAAALSSERFDPTYYLDERYRRCFSDVSQNLVRVRQEVDPYLCLQLGYEI